MGVVLGQNLGQITYNIVKKVKKLTLSIPFFHILHQEYLLNQKAVVALTPEWKFTVDIARNATFEGRYTVAYPEGYTLGSGA